VTKERWLVIGANGALGTDLIEIFGDKAIPAFHSDFDISDKQQSFSFIKKQPVTGIINTAAYHHVPSCEEHPDKAFKVNTLGVRNLSEISTYLKLHLCHISTDYVFDGEKQLPYTEADLPNPLNSYAISKLAGEYMVKAYASSHSIIRSCGLYGRIPTRAKCGNFLTAVLTQAMLKEPLTIVNDEIVAPTYTRELAVGIKELLAHKPAGIFHINQAGQTTWYDFARHLLKHFELDVEIKPVSRDFFQTGLKRPAYSILNCQKFENLTGISMSSWDSALTSFLDENGQDLLNSL